jgi:hypothetical protein
MIQVSQRGELEGSELMVCCSVISCRMSFQRANSRSQALIVIGTVPVTHGVCNGVLGRRAWTAYRIRSRYLTLELPRVRHVFLVGKANSAPSRHYNYNTSMASIYSTVFHFADAGEPMHTSS